ncbi:MAG: YdcF family protein, partial [Rubrivivax sp.]
MLNDLFGQFGIEGWKPLLSALLLPPLPLLLLMLVGASLVRRRPPWAWGLLLAGAAGIWLSATTGLGEALQRPLLGPGHALAAPDLQQLRQHQRSSAAPTTAIVVLGGGRESLAPEYGTGSLSGQTLERLRYGLWLARETALPVAFSGGTGHGQTPGPSEAEIAALIAAREFGRPLKWIEANSRDTRENAAHSVALLRPAGVTQIVLVTHGGHMRRSLRAFEQAI